jgi:hypothetical protein
MGDTIRIQGQEADFSNVIATTPVAYTTSSTPVLSAAVDTTSYPRKRIFVIFQHAADATSTGVTVAVTESATSGGSYSACTTTGTAGASTAARTTIVQVKRNAAKPFLKTSITPAGGSGVISASFLFIP